MTTMTARDDHNDKAEYYRIAFQMARSKALYPEEHFRSLLGDKDQQAVFEAVAKVEKTMSKSQYTRPYRNRFASPYIGLHERMNFHCVATTARRLVI